MAFCVCVCVWLFLAVFLPWCLLLAFGSQKKISWELERTKKKTEKNETEIFTPISAFPSQQTIFYMISKSTTAMLF
jgi:hypothetical protein